MDAVPLLEQVSTKKFVNDVECMLIGIESDTFEYAHTVYIYIFYTYIPTEMVEQVEIYESCFVDWIQPTKRH